MAGQHVQPPKELSKFDSQLATISYPAGSAQEIPFFIAPYDIVIQDAKLRHDAIDDTVGQTAKVSKYANGSGSRTDITAVSAVLTANANTNKSMALVTVNGVPSENIVRAGELVVLRMNGAIGAMTGLVATLTYTRSVL